MAETVAREGFSAVMLDMQHGLWDTASVVAAIGAICHAGAAPVVRVPLSDFASARRALDFGAEAIIAPMINNERDAKANSRRRPNIRRSASAAGVRIRAMALQGRTSDRWTICARPMKAR